MNNSHYNTTNWKQYNAAVSNHDSLTFWIDKKAIRLWNKTK
ncbi:Mobile element protein [Candidatus Enterovibrio altilux]|uniref:Mobile element protein n=1 Tax=Candidatus Enterovibrio altilux TaxID=1927128 RepID=A0A291B9G6_9GAMM|nr:Mobile element protein [Candidatus Enterovibrio luxaltus]